MSSFAFLVLAVQACLLQNVYSQCLGSPVGLGCAGLGGIGLAESGLGLGLAPYGAGLGSPYGAGIGPAYGGVGIGEVAVAGELGVGGLTAVAGQVPILGAVEFGGCVPAGGCVSIAGNCACGCNGLGGRYY